MGNIPIVADKVFNAPPLGPKCVPKCTPLPITEFKTRGSICYKGSCVPECPKGSLKGEDGTCICTLENYKYIPDNTKKQKPEDGDGWGQCIQTDEEERILEPEEEKIFNDKFKEIEESKDLSKEEKEEKIQIIKKIKKKEEEKPVALVSKFNPVSIFKNRVPKELDERVKNMVKESLKQNPNMNDEELTQLISNVTLQVVEELSLECQNEYSLIKTILSPKYGNGKWPDKETLKILIKDKKFPWLPSQVNQWPEEKDITSCQLMTSILDKIKMNNRCIYSQQYSKINKECDVSCGTGIEIREKVIIKDVNIDFPSFNECQSKPPTKEFTCETGKICKEDCKIEIDIKSFGEARCSKPCDSGDGPGEKTYKVKYVSSSKGEPGDKGSCDIDEEGKVEGETYDVTVPCNEEACPACNIKSKGPYKDDTVDYTRNLDSKVYTACLLPKKDGTFEDIDCGGNEGGFNFEKGARSRYNVTYNVTKDEYGVQNCTIGKTDISEACPVNAFEPNMNPIVKSDGKLLTGGGEPCGNECVLSDDYPQLVLVDGKECSKECGTGKKRMRKVVKAKSDAPYCPCKNDPSKCPYEEVDCNTDECIAPCVYDNDGKHVQINDYCPGVKGPNKHIVWDTKKVNPDGGKGMWYDSIKNKYYPRNHFVKKMRVPTKIPPVGKGLCYQGNKKDKTLQCSIEGTEKPIDAVWGPWKYDSHVGEPTVVQAILPKYKNWNDASNPNLQSKIEKRIQDRLDAKEKDPITGEILTEDRIRKEENHCVDESYIEMSPEFYAEPGIKYTRSIQVFPEYGGKEASGPFDKTVPYMKKDDGSYTRYCPVDKVLQPEIWEGDGDQTGPEWDEDKCYSPTATGNRRDIKYTVKELEQEATKSFTRDVNLPEYSDTRKGEQRIIDRGTRSIYRFKTRHDTLTPSEKHGGLPAGKWHSVTKGVTNDMYDKRINEYDECEGVKEIIKKIKNNDQTWKSNNIVLQKDCNPVYDWDGKYYISQETAKQGKTGEEIVRPQHESSNQSGISEKYPGENVRRSGKFLFSSTWNDTQYHECGLDKEGEKNNTGWHYKSGLGNSTLEWIIMETETGNVEIIKGIVLQGRGDAKQGLQGNFKISVSRNGDSWKTVKNSNDSETFNNNHNIKDEIARHNYNKHYFKQTEQAKFIKIHSFPTRSSFRMGYIKDLSNTVDCFGGDGILKEQPWFRLTFNEAKTRESGGYSEGTHSSTVLCPSDGAVFTYQRNTVPTTEFKNLKLNSNGTIKDNLQQELSSLSSNLGGCGKDAVRAGWRSSISGGSFGWSDCVKPDSEGLATSTKAWNTDDGGFNYIYNVWSSSSENSDYKKWSDNDKNKADSGHSSTAVEKNAYKAMPKTFTNQDFYKYNIIRQPCHRGVTYKAPTYDDDFYGESDGTTHTGGTSSTYCAGGVKGTTGSVWKCINVNKDAVEGWKDSSQKKEWGTNVSPGYIANIVREALKGKFGSTDRKDLTFFKWGLKTIHPECDQAGSSRTWNNSSWSCTGSMGKARANQSLGRGYLRYHKHRWSKPNTNTVKFNLGSTQVVKGIYYQRGWSHKNRLPRFWKIKVGNTTVKNANGDNEWALPETDSFQYIMFDPNKNYSGSTVTFYDIHNGSSGYLSFKASFFVKDTTKYSVWKDISKNCKTTVEKPVPCVEGSSAGVKRKWWTNPDWGKWGSWSRCAYSSGSGDGMVFKKTRTRTRKNYQKGEYKVTGAKHGGRNNCSNITYDINNKEEKDNQSTNCTRHEYSNNKHCCRSTKYGTSPRWWHQSSERSSSNAQAACKKYMKQHKKPACDWLHTDHNVFGSAGTYFTQIHDYCNQQKASNWNCQANWWGGAFEYK